MEPSPTELRMRARELWRQADRLEAAERASQIVNTVQPWTIVELAAGYYHIESARLMTRARSQRLTGARQLAAYLLRQETTLSFPQIGRILHRHHSTAIWSVEQVEAQMLRKPIFATEVANLRTRCRASLMAA